MSLVLLNGHPKDLGGGFMVRRVLPAVQRQGVGPFLFFDHFGPVTVEPGAGHDVRPHPHIGLATVSYLFEGAIQHRDSLGYNQRIEPGAINWMTAGCGIVHSERQPVDLQQTAYVNHGIQLWAALPLELEEEAPRFEHTPAAAMPQLALPGANVRVLVGSALGASSPVRAIANAVYLDISLAAGATLALPALAQELAVYPVDANLQVDGDTVAMHTMAVLAAGLGALLRADSAVRLMVLGGDALEGRRHMWWNFVSSRKQRIVQAAADWEAQGMGRVPGETEFIPLPEHRFNAG